MNKAQLLVKWLQFDSFGFRAKDIKDLRETAAYTSFASVMKYEAIFQALLFWEFIQNQVTLKNCSRAMIKDFLELFLNSRNPYIRLVAMIESLPTSVWRKILWRYNIDFMSFESMLRRISKAEMQAIADNFNDFVGGKIPRVFTKWNIRFKGISTESLANEAWNYRERHTTKGSMSYNLMGLDFGFNAYPKGVANDTKVVEISPFRFLSLKEHADDFVVNQEDGKYWWLYKFIRSNFAYFPNRDVELKTHVCPGFWYTLIMHCVLWFVSPIAAFITLTKIADTGVEASFGFLAPAITGSLITLWLLSATLRGIFSGIAYFTDNVVPDSLSEGVKNFFASVGIGIGALIVIVLSSAITILASGLFREDEYLFSVTRAVLVFGTLSVFARSAFGVRNNKIHIQGWSYFSNSVQSTIKFLLLAVLVLWIIQYIHLILAFLWTLLIDIVNVLVAAWNYVVIFFTEMINAFAFFFADLGPYAWLLVLGMALPFLLLYLTSKFSDDKKYPRMAEFMVKRAPKIMIGIALAGIVSSWVFGVSNLGALSSSSLDIYMLIGSSAYFILMLGMILMVNRSIYKYDRRLDDFLEIFAMNTTQLTDWGIRPSDAAYTALSNRFLCSLSFDEKKKAIAKIFDAATKLPYISNDLTSAKHSKAFILTTMLGTIDNKKLLERLFLVDKILPYFRHYSPYSFAGFHDYVSQSNLETFFRLLEKMGPIKAMKEVRRINDEKQMEELREMIEFTNRFKEFRRKIWSVVGYPFIKIKNGFRALYGIYDLFMRRCPFIAKPRSLV